MKLKTKQDRCKHIGKYTVLMPLEGDSSEYFNTLKKTDNLRSFLKNMVFVEEISYMELNQEDKKTIDANWQEYLGYAGCPSFCKVKSGERVGILEQN